MNRPDPQPILRRIHSPWLQAVDVGVGWWEILVELDLKLSAIDPDYEIHQVKEKFGHLRFYCTLDSEERAVQFVREAEDKASLTCYFCGASATVKEMGLPSCGCVLRDTTCMRKTTIGMLVGESCSRLGRKIAEGEPTTLEDSMQAVGLGLIANMFGWDTPVIEGEENVEALAPFESAEEPEAEGAVEGLRPASEAVHLQPEALHEGPVDPPGHPREDDG